MQIDMTPAKDVYGRRMFEQLFSRGTSSLTVLELREERVPYRWSVIYPINHNIASFAILKNGTANARIIGNDNRFRLDATERTRQEYIPAVSDVQSNADLRVQRLIHIKAAFGIPNTDLARICGVSRTQLYKWLSSEVSIQLTTNNWQRLAELDQVALDWNKLSSRPIAELLDERVIGNKTLMEFLELPLLDLTAIKNVLRKLAAIVSSRPLRQDEKLRQRGIKPRPLLGELARDD
jgi:DNA-binding phage protein